jgi:hypothetical protein
VVAAPIASSFQYVPPCDGIVNPMSSRPWTRSAVILCAPSSLPTTAVTATFPASSGLPESSVPDSSPSRRSSTRWATLLT